MRSTRRTMITMAALAALAALAVLAGASPRALSVEFDPVFTSHAVLQAGVPHPVSGTGDPGERVSVTFGLQTRESVVNDEGRWTVWLDPLDPSWVPGQMDVCNPLGDWSILLSFSRKLVYYFPTVSNDGVCGKIGVMYYDQSEFDIRCEWGEKGVAALAPISDAIIIVDVMSFSTAVTIATNRGAVVYPFKGTAEQSRRVRQVGQCRNGRQAQKGQILPVPCILDGHPCQAPASSCHHPMVRRSPCPLAIHQPSPAACVTPQR